MLLQNLKSYVKMWLKSLYKLEDAETIVLKCALWPYTVCHVEAWVCAISPGALFSTGKKRKNYWAGIDLLYLPICPLVYTQGQNAVEHTSLEI